MNLGRVLGRLAIALSLCGALVGPTRAEQACADPRMALVIGNATYPDDEAALREPLGNARSISESLKAIGFAATEAENLTREQMLSALATFEARIDRNAFAVLVFSGYGIQAGGRTYLIPVDAKIWNEEDVKTYGIGLERIQSDLAAHGAGVRIVVVDAARRNPYERRFRLSGSSGLAPARGTSGSLTLFSAAPGATFEESPGPTSPFADALTKQIARPGAMAEDAFRRTRVDVSHNARAGQTPWVSSFLPQDVGLNGRDCPPKPAPTADAAPERPEPPAKPMVVAPAPVAPVEPPAARPIPVVPPVARALPVSPAPAVAAGAPPAARPLPVAPSVPPPPVSPPPHTIVAAAPIPAPVPEPPTVRRAPQPVRPTAVLPMDDPAPASPAPTVTPPPVIEARPRAPVAAATQPTPPPPVAAMQRAEIKPAPLAEPPIVPTADRPIDDVGLLDEIKDRLFEQSYDPGDPGSPAMAAAIRAYEEKAGLPPRDRPTMRLLRALREARALKPWGAIAFAPDAKVWGMSWGSSSRREALAVAMARCGSAQCVKATSFSSRSCGAFALSPRSWAITWRQEGVQARQAALENCAQKGPGCRVIGATCADGSERLP